MNTLKEAYGALVEQDQVKIAEAQASEEMGADLSGVDEDLIKQAQSYDTIGRVMAHHAFADLVKEAIDEEMAGEPEDKKKEELSKILAKARGEGPAEGEGEGEKKKKKPEGDEDEGEGEGEGDEKKAHVRQAILDKMASDPDYAAYLAAKYLEG